MIFWSDGFPIISHLIEDFCFKGNQKQENQLLPTLHTNKSAFDHLGIQKCVRETNDGLLHWSSRQIPPLRFIFTPTVSSEFLLQLMFAISQSKALVQDFLKSHIVRRQWREPPLQSQPQVTSTRARLLTQCRPCTHSSTCGPRAARLRLSEGKGRRGRRAVGRRRPTRGIRWRRCCLCSNFWNVAVCSQSLSLTLIQSFFGVLFLIGLHQNIGVGTVNCETLEGNKIFPEEIMSSRTDGIVWLSEGKGHESIFLRPPKIPLLSPSPEIGCV